ncbi:Transcriptional regulatory protein MucR [compost metagenome]
MTPQNPKIIVPVDQSVFDDYIVCLFDGMKRKMMHRHVKAVYGMSWDEYKAYCKLPSDYPAVAPGYAREKSEVAAQLGLGVSSPTVPVEIPKTLRDKLRPLALNEGMTIQEFIAHLLTEHILSVEQPDKN